MKNDKLADYILKTRKLGKYKDNDITHEKALEAIDEYQISKSEEEYIKLMKYIHFREMLPINLGLIAISLYVFSLIVEIVYLLFQI